MMTNQCPKCIHFWVASEKASCDAFPDGIPTEILVGNFDHSKPFSGDSGIRFRE